jgi:hypothetical protein
MAARLAAKIIRYRKTTRRSLVANDRYEMKTSLFALAVLVAMTGAALPQFRTFYDSTSGGVTGRATTDSGGATTYYGADGGRWPLSYHRQHHDDP